MADFSFEIGFFSVAVSELKNMENMTCCKYGAYNTFYISTWNHGICNLHDFNILYETCDSVLQYVHFPANSHNFHINTFTTILII